MRQYSIDKVELTWAGLDFKEGFAAGTTLTEARTVVSWAIKDTGVGNVVRVFNPSKSGTLTVLVDQESNLHQQLRLLAQTDEVSRNVVFPGRLYNSTNAEVINYKNMFILSQPDETFGTESATIPWVFGFQRREEQAALDNANVVGQ